MIPVLSKTISEKSKHRTHQILEVYCDNRIMQIMLWFNGEHNDFYKYPSYYRKMQTLYLSNHLYDDTFTVLMDVSRC